MSVSATHASLDELLALRLRAQRLRLAPSHSHLSNAGQHHSHLYGRGMDYAESRAYQPGDDIRRLDWRLTARSGKLHTKIFQEDRQGCLLILLDTHATLAFGTRGCFKSVAAARAAALAGWLVAQAGEQVGLACFGQSTLLQKPGTGRRGALALCRALVDSQHTIGKTDTALAATLRQVRALPQRPSRILLISDGFQLDNEDEKALLALRQHSRLALLGIADALEVAPPAAGDYAVEAAGRTLSLPLYGQARERFFQQLNQGQQRLQALARRQGLACARLTCQDDPLPALAQLLGQGLAR